MWFSIIDTRVFNRLKNETTKKLKNKKDINKKEFKINYTTVSKSYENLSRDEIDERREEEKKKLPTVYLRKMQGGSKGRTTELGAINAIESVFQIEVATNTSQNDALTIAEAVADVMVSIGYDMIGEPFPDNDSDIYKVFSRWRRTVAYNDVLNF